MTGEYEHNIDVKGRLFIPAKLREELGTVFYVTLSPERCLSAYSSETWDNITEKVNSMPFSAQRKMRPVFAHAAKCELDSQGRINIPTKLRDYAELKKSVTVIGSNNHAEFWDTDKWNEIDLLETTPENISAAMEELGF